MKRMGDRSRDAAVLGGQPVERGNGLVIAQHDRDLAAGLAVGGGASRPVFGLHDSNLAIALGALGQAIFQPLRNFHDLAAVVVRQLLVASRLGINVVAGMGEGKAAGTFGVFAVLGGEGHVELRLWTTGPSSHVTSDASTTVCREAFQ